MPAAERWILAGDLGGTKINLALFREPAGAPGAELELVREETYATAAAAGLGQVAREFLGADAGRIGAASFGVAGPVVNNRAQMVNVHFAIDGRELAGMLALPRVELLNDLVATGYGLNILPLGAVLTLNPGTANPTGNGALIAAGTGLGKAILLHDPHHGDEWRPLPSEGGHNSFAPENDLQVELLRYLWRRVGGPVDTERILSGPGLYLIYKFLRDTWRIEEPAGLRMQLEAAEDPSRIVSEAGLAGGPPICRRALEMFIEIYGAEAGNFGLNCLATGGVWLGGGIAPKILPLLKTELFLQAFFSKDRVGHVMRPMPVHVILEPKAALYGAAHYAVLNGQ